MSVYLRFGCTRFGWKILSRWIVEQQLQVFQSHNKGKPHSRRRKRRPMYVGESADVVFLSAGVFGVKLGQVRSGYDAEQKRGRQGTPALDSS